MVPAGNVLKLESNSRLWSWIIALVLKRKEKNLIRDPARSSTNSRKSTLLLGEKFLDKGHSWVYGMGWGVGFRLGRKSFGAGCAKNENGGSCMTLVKIIFIPRLRYNMLAS